MPRPKSAARAHPAQGPAPAASSRLAGPDHYLGHWPAGREYTARGGPRRVPQTARRVAREQPLTRRRGTPRTACQLTRVLLAFWERHAALHHRHEDGTPTSELADYKLSLRPVCELYGETPAAEFGPKKLKAVREHQVRRRTVPQGDQPAGRADEAGVPVGGRRGAGAARRVRGFAGGGRAQGRPVRRPRDAARSPRPGGALRRRPALPPTAARAIVELQRWTGMRPGEACRLQTHRDRPVRPDGLDLPPGRHKTKHHGKARAVAVGPKGRAVVLAFLAGRVPCPATPRRSTCPTRRPDRRPPTGSPPRAGRSTRRYSGTWRSRSSCSAGRSSTRRFPVQPGPGPRGAVRGHAARPADEGRNRPRCVGGRGSRRSGRAPATAPRALHKAIATACDKAGVPHWHPNQIRHLRATEIRPRARPGGRPGHPRPRPGGRHPGVRRAGPGPRARGGGPDGVSGRISNVVRSRSRRTDTWSRPGKSPGRCRFTGWRPAAKPAFGRKVHRTPPERLPT